MKVKERSGNSMAWKIYIFQTKSRSFSNFPEVLWILSFGDCLPFSHHLSNANHNFVAYRRYLCVHRILCTKKAR